jgi:hypothetical protein
MMTWTVIFLVIDFYYICWIYQVRHKFPPYIADYLSKALFGFGAQMMQVLRANLQRFPKRGGSGGVKGRGWDEKA